MKQSQDAPSGFPPTTSPLTKKNRSGPSLVDVKDMIHVYYVNTIKLLKEAYHIIREEATEFLAFIAADSTRVPEPGIPRHIPIAYGLKFYSLPMTIMCHLINDVRDNCKVANVSISL